MHTFELENVKKRTRFACTRSEFRTGRMTILATARHRVCGYIYIYIYIHITLLSRRMDFERIEGILLYNNLLTVDLFCKNIGQQATFFCCNQCYSVDGDSWHHRALSQKNLCGPRSTASCDEQPEPGLRLEPRQMRTSLTSPKEASAQPSIHHTGRSRDQLTFPAHDA